jgi:hypothetical protein
LFRRLKVSQAFEKQKKPFLQAINTRKYKVSKPKKLTQVKPKTKKGVAKIRKKVEFSK